MSLGKKMLLIVDRQLEQLAAAQQLILLSLIKIWTAVDYI
jgi:hypothetical protein